jgi:porin
VIRRRRRALLLRSAARVAAAVAFSGYATTAHGQSDPGDNPVGGATDVTGVGKIGRLEDIIRRALLFEPLYTGAADLSADYARWKTAVAEGSSVKWSMELSLLQQWGLSGGGSPALQVYVAPSLDWTLFKSTTWGTGSVQAAYTAITHYPTTQDAAAIQSNLGLITPINDDPVRSMTFAQLTYTQASVDNQWLFTLGQYPLANFDGNAYLGNQQQNFNNYLFAQNGTQTYLDTGLGGYVQINVTSAFQLAAGLQSANNASGQSLSGRNFGSDCCAWFGYAQWTPALNGLGTARYSISYFDTPGIPAQPATRGWSFNAVQNLDDTWAVFARANGASGNMTPISASYAIGAAINNPWQRAATDQVALAVGLSVAANPPTNPPSARNEKVIEGYWTWTFFGRLLLTPSAQITFDPAVNPSKNSVTTLSLRATVMF